MKIIVIVIYFLLGIFYMLGDAKCRGTDAENLRCGFSAFAWPLVVAYDAGRFMR